MVSVSLVSVSLVSVSAPMAQGSERHGSAQVCGHIPRAKDLFTNVRLTDDVDEEDDRVDDHLVAATPDRPAAVDSTATGDERCCTH